MSTCLLVTIKAEVSKHALNIKQPVDGVCYDINAGKYPIVGSDAKKYYFSLHDGVTKAALCDPAEGLYVSKKDDKQICVVTIYGGTACYDAIFDIKDYNVVSADHIQRTLIFQGKKEILLNLCMLKNLACRRS